MTTVIKSRIVKIGNSQGIRIPKLLLDQAGLDEEVELVIENDHIIIRPAQASRLGWEVQFQKMAAFGDDRLLDEEALPQLTPSDETDWAWRFGA